MTQTTSETESDPGGQHLLKSLARDAGEKLGEMASNFEGEAIELSSSVRDYIKRNSVESLAIALAVGALTGGLLASVMARRR